MENDYDKENTKNLRTWCILGFINLDSLKLY